MNKRKKNLFFLLICCLLLTSVSGCSPAAEQVSRSGFYFDTIITITLYNTSNEGYIDHCFELAEKYERKFSNTIMDSEISLINQNAGQFVTVSDETLSLLQSAIDFGEKSDGFFDITIGPLTKLWDISSVSSRLQTENNEAEASVLPSKEEVLKTLQHVDYHTIEIANHQVRLVDKKASIDLGGIAKGYIADRMKEYLNENGITSGIINLGGNVLTLGEKESKEPYKIGIQRPFGNNGESIGTLSVKDASVVSSGIYERYYRVNDKIYHHILDPTTGYPVKNELWQVTIISQSSLDGDALSTACFSLGLDAGLDLIESLDQVEAIFVTCREEIITSSGIGSDILFSAEESLN